MSSNETSVVKFDLTNSLNPQDSPAGITVSAPGHTSIAKCAMVPAADDGAPLKVVSPQFTVRFVEQSSNSNLVTSNMKELFRSIGRGSVVYIEDIVVSMPDGTDRALPTMKLKVI